MPNKHEISSNPAPVSEQGHKMYRSLVGPLTCVCGARHGIAYGATRLAQGSATPTKGQCHMLALERVMAYLGIVPDMRTMAPIVVA